MYKLLDRALESRVRHGDYAGVPGEYIIWHNPHILHTIHLPPGEKPDYADIQEWQEVDTVENTRKRFGRE
jgi:hypothetical protein